MNEQDTSKAEQGRTESPLAESFSEVINAAFGVGAAIAKTLAEATASDKNVATPEAGQGPLGDMVHYGVTTVTNVIGLVISMMGSAKSPGGESTQPFSSNQNKTTDSAANVSSAANATTGTTSNKPTFPTVHQGGTLRMPLSLENPGDQVMEDLVFRCQKMVAQRIGAGQPLTEEALRFQPERLDIAPKDFEKLTLLIDTTEQTAPGRYTAHIGVVDGGLEINVEFEVVPDMAPSGETT